MPCGSALLGGLAEEETELLQALAENVLSRHSGMAGMIQMGSDIEENQDPETPKTRRASSAEGV